MFNLIQLKKILLLVMLSVSLIHCGGSSAPTSNNSPAPSAGSNLTPGKSFPNITPPRSTITSPNSTNPGTSVPNPADSPAANSPSEAEIDTFATDFITAVCGVANRCDARIQIQECSRYLQNEGGDQIWCNLGISVSDVQALVDALETGTITISETNLETCVTQFANQCQSPNPNLMGGSYQNIENIIPDTRECSHVFVPASSVSFHFSSPVNPGGAVSPNSVLPASDPISNNP
ncbi:MAG: hypothetical protein HQM15_06525 [Deltaproteobacteria bacterium]|nr:hypothetical protein [Deltaproteobacteria bacterium]